MGHAESHRLPTWGQMQYQLDGATLTEVPPEHCPRGHPLLPGRMLLGWSPANQGRSYTCLACDRDDPMRSWCSAPSPVPGLEAHQSSSPWTRYEQPPVPDR